MKLKAVARLKAVAAYDFDGAKKKAIELLDNLKDSEQSGKTLALQVSKKTGLPIEDVELLMKNRGWFVK